jgi:DNA-binding NtrC family response regulator
MNTSNLALVIEPDLEVGKMLQMLLRLNFSFDTSVVRTIDEAIAAMEQEKYAALVVDISRSAERLSQLTHETKKQKSAVIVLTTGRLDRETLELFVSDHVFAVFPKPFDPDTLVETLREGLEAVKHMSVMKSLLHGFLKDGK